MPNTDERNDEFGMYVNDCCGSEIVIGPGAVFPVAPNTRRPPAGSTSSLESIFRTWRLPEITDPKASATKGPVKMSSVTGMECRSTSFSPRPAWLYLADENDGFTAAASTASTTAARTCTSAASTVIWPSSKQYP